MFWLRKRKENVEQPALSEEIKLLKGRLVAVEAQILEVMVAQNILRNKVLRKIQTKLIEEPEEEAEKEQDTWAGIPKTK